MRHCRILISMGYVRHKMHKILLHRNENYTKYSYSSDSDRYGIIEEIYNCSIHDLISYKMDLSIDHGVPFKRNCSIKNVSVGD